MSTKKTIKNDAIRSNVNKGVSKDSDKKSGVIQTILYAIQKKEQTKDTLLKLLVKSFPERDSDSMKKTIQAQLSATRTGVSRMEKERGVEFNREKRLVKNLEVTFISYAGQKEWQDEETEE